jgi:predicted TIM-barrel fold metal-dependent hydrolase
MVHENCVHLEKLTILRVLTPHSSFYDADSQNCPIADKMLKTPLPALNDIEDHKIPSSLPFVVDSHVHIFPEGIFKAIWDWFDKYGWPIRYRLTSPDVLNYLLSRGVGHIVALQYAHKSGTARKLNSYMAEICQEFPNKVTGMATVFPGEKESESILKEAFKMGLKGVKLHAHVQCFNMNSEDMDIIYNLCSSEGKPIVMHVGREPNSPAYKCDPYMLCNAKKLEKVIMNYPKLKICVPHLGVDEFLPYKQLIEKYDNLWLDTSMALADYLPIRNPIKLDDMRLNRIMYGSDFPNIPYAWDREIKWFKERNFSYESIERILRKNAFDFFNIQTN